MWYSGKCEAEKSAPLDPAVSAAGGVFHCPSTIHESNCQKEVTVRRTGMDGLSAPDTYHQADRARIRTDILVVGAGISGALIAYTLARQGHRVVVIDRRGLLTGSTPASTALLLFEIDTPLIHLKREIGARPAERAWLRSKSALDALYKLTRDRGFTPR